MRLNIGKKKKKKAGGRTGGGDEAIFFLQRGIRVGSRCPIRQAVGS